MNEDVSFEYTFKEGQYVVITQQYETINRQRTSDVLWLNDIFATETKLSQGYATAQIAEENAARSVGYWCDTLDKELFDLVVSKCDNSPEYPKPPEVPAITLTCIVKVEKMLYDPRTVIDSLASIEDFTNNDVLELP